MLLRLACAVILVALLAGCKPITAPDPGQAAQAYRAEMVTALSGFSEALDGVIAASAAPNVSDQKWRDDLLAHLAAIREVQPKLQAVTPPAALAESHTQLQSAIGLCVAGAEKMEPGIEAGKVDYAGLYGAAALFQQCAQEMTAPLTEMGDYLKKFE